MDHRQVLVMWLFVVSILIAETALGEAQPAKICSDPHDEGKILSFSTCAVIFCYNHKLIALLRDIRSSQCFAELLPAYNNFCTVNGLLHLSGKVVRFYKYVPSVDICFGKQGIVSIVGLSTAEMPVI